jgi:hypothetical protein
MPWPYIVGIGVAIAAALIAVVVPAVHRSREHYAEAAAQQRHLQVLVAASRVALPSQFTVTNRLGDGGACLQGQNVRCWLVSSSPADTTSELTSALRSAGLVPQRPTCAKFPHLDQQSTTGRARKSCSVVATSNGWNITLFADTRVTNGRAQGSTVTMSVS